MALNVSIALGTINILTVFVLQSRSMQCLSFCVIFNFFHKCSKSTDLSPLWLEIFLSVPNLFLILIHSGETNNLLLTLSFPTISYSPKLH